MNAILAKKSCLPFYRGIPLYTKTDNNRYVLYKPAGLTLGEMRLDEGLHPAALYLDAEDKISGLQDIQQAFNQELKQQLEVGKTEEIKKVLVNIVEETFDEPRSGSLEGMTNTIETLIGGYADKGNVVLNLSRVFTKDYTTALHSINVTVFTLAFCFHNPQLLDSAQSLGMSALLHDVGKTAVPVEILNAARKLTDEEFEIMKNHPEAGANILQACDFDDENIVLGALEHHEKIDGAGYPRGIKEISFVGRLLSIIDCYEAITSDTRPYRNAAPPLDALTLLKREVHNHKYDAKLFEKFAYSLT
jgi:HD-GYP domain-containing protein (c-di-GMP phosphodiesterase class II)